MTYGIHSLGTAPASTELVWVTPRAAAPAVGSLAISGHAPTVGQPHSAAPGAGAVTITGHAPTIAQPIAVAPAVGSLVITGHAPSVRQVSARAAEVWGHVLENGLTAEQVLIAVHDALPLVEALAKLHALIPGVPLVVTPTSRTAGDVSQTITESAGTVTVARV